MESKRRKRIVSDESGSGIGRKRKPSDSDSDSVVLPIPIATRFFDLHWNARLFTLPTPTLLPFMSLVETSSQLFDFSENTGNTDLSALARGLTVGIYFVYEIQYLEWALKTIFKKKQTNKRAWAWYWEDSIISEWALKRSVENWVRDEFGGFVALG